MNSNDSDHRSSTGAAVGAYAHLDLETEALQDYWSAALAWLRDRVEGEPGRMADVGAGNGAGSVGLAQQFPSALVIAVDNSTDLLSRVHARACALDLAARIDIVHADLDATWPDELHDLDLTLASMSLHHSADPDRVLRSLCAATRPDGLLAVAETGRPMRYLRHDQGVGRPGLEERATAVIEPHLHASMPTRHSAWAPRLRAGGWVIVDEHEFPLAPATTWHPSVYTLARRYIEGLARRAGPHLDRDDRQHLASIAAALADPQGTGGRHLDVGGSRVVTLGRRPSR